MRPRDFLDVADDLVAGNREADWRSGASRAYYATFHAAREILIRCGFVVPDAHQSHGYVWLRISNCGHPQLAGTGDRLREMRRRRNWADYDFEHLFEQSAAVHCMNDALSAFQILEPALTMPELLTQIAATILDYERDVLKHVTWKP